jgi:hypothetical protein
MWSKLMKPQVNTNTAAETTQDVAPQPLSLDVLRYVAGGLPYGGWHEPPADLVTVPEGELPYGGW